MFLFFRDCIKFRIHFVRISCKIKTKRFRARSHLATAMQIFDVVSMSWKMGCMVTNITIRTWRQKKDIVVVKYDRALKARSHKSCVNNNFFVSDTFIWNPFSRNVIVAQDIASVHVNHSYATHSLADLRGALGTRAPLGPIFKKKVCSFRKQMAKIDPIDLHYHLWGWRPSPGKFWIHHCHSFASIVYR